MSVVETERQGQIMTIRLNRPERMNAMGYELPSRSSATTQSWRLLYSPVPVAPFVPART